MASPFVSAAITHLGVLAGALFAVGAQWDTKVHLERGHTLLEPAHLMVLAGFMIFTFCGLLALCTLMTRRKSLSAKQRNGFKTIVLGASILPISIVVDELWHKLFGTDMTAWSPPHLAIFFGTMSVLFGLAQLQVHRIDNEKNSRTISFAHIRILFFLAMIFYVLIYAFLDFDLPRFATILKRPGFAYPIALSGMIVLLLPIAQSLGKFPWTGTLSATAAWISYMGSGLLLSNINSSIVIPHPAPPFPFIVPALCFDLCVFIFWKHKLSPSILALWRTNLATYTVCYWGIIAWAKLYTHLAHQLSGAFNDWIMWYAISAPIVSLLSCAVTRMIIHLTLREVPAKTKKAEAP